MINNISAIGLMFGFFVFLYFFVDYFKTRFKDKWRLSEEFDLLFIIPMFVTILFFTVLLMESTTSGQDRVLAGWFSFVTVLFAPFIMLILVAWFKKFLSLRKKPGMLEEHEE